MAPPRGGGCGDARLLGGPGSAGGSGAPEITVPSGAASTPVSVASPVATIVGWPV